MPRTCDADLIWCHTCACEVEGLYSRMEARTTEQPEEILTCIRCGSEDVQIVDVQDFGDLYDVY